MEANPVILPVNQLSLSVRFALRMLTFAYVSPYELFI